MEAQAKHHGDRGPECDQPIPTELAIIAAVLSATQCKPAIECLDEAQALFRGALCAIRDTIRARQFDEVERDHYVELRSIQVKTQKDFEGAKHCPRIDLQIHYCAERQNETQPNTTHVPLEVDEIGTWRGFRNAADRLWRRGFLAETFRLESGPEKKILDGHDFAAFADARIQEAVHDFLSKNPECRSRAPMIYRRSSPIEGCGWVPIQVKVQELPSDSQEHTDVTKVVLRKKGRKVKN